MFFKRSKLTYAPEESGPRILALASDSELSDIRVRPFLNALLARGIIGSFQFADRRMKPIGWLRSARFTHIWCQRNVSTAQYRFLRKHAHVPIIYDIDDLLTDVPEFVLKWRPRIVERINWCLTNANVVTTATARLEERLRLRVPSKTKMIILKNGHAGCYRAFRPAPSKHILWTSGDVPFVLRDHPGFMQNLADLVNRHSYEMIFIGRFDPNEMQMFNRRRHIQRLDFSSYREFLHFYAGSLAIAPLPSGLPAPVQQFFDAKSDIKLVDYFSAGLVPVCTSTPPYSDSELFLPELAASDPNGLLEKLEKCITDHSGMIDYVHAGIHAKEALKQKEFIELSKVLDGIFD